MLEEEDENVLKLTVEEHEFSLVGSKKLFLIESSEVLLVEGELMVIVLLVVIVVVAILWITTRSTLRFDCLRSSRVETFQLFRKQ